jgi:hypothetical protein
MELQSDRARTGLRATALVLVGLIAITVLIILAGPA